MRMRRDVSNRGPIIGDLAFFEDQIWGVYRKEDSSLIRGCWAKCGYSLSVGAMLCPQYIFRRSSMIQDEHRMRRSLQGGCSTGLLIFFFWLATKAAVCKFGTWMITAAETLLISCRNWKETRSETWKETLAVCIHSCIHPALTPLLTGCSTTPLPSPVVGGLPNSIIAAIKNKSLALSYTT